MSKVIESPVKRFPGRVTLSDPLTMPQYMAWVDAAQAAELVDHPAKKQVAYLPGVLACVEKWELTGIPEKPTVDTFPASPAQSSVKLVFVLVNAIWEIVNAEDEVPNA